MPPRQSATVSEGRSKYQVLVHTSVPQRDPATGLKTGQSDLIPPGEIVELTEAEAAHLMDTGPRSGHRVPLIRPLSEQHQPLPRVHPAHASGHQFGPGVNARPDPAGSSRIQVMTDAPPASNAGEQPEAHEPQPGSESQLPSDLMDALDIELAR